MTAPNRLRIIGGEWRGRRLAFAAVPGLRPTPDRVRETLFNWLQAEVPGARCLDLFAGSGALGLEALSRGAAEVTFVDRAPVVARCLADQLGRLHAANRARVTGADARRYLAGAAMPFDVVFLDPPFRSSIIGPVCADLESRGWLAGRACIYLEMDRHRGMPELPEGWAVTRERTAGDVLFALARRGAGKEND